MDFSKENEILCSLFKYFAQTLGEILFARTVIRENLQDSPGEVQKWVKSEIINQHCQNEHF